MKDDIKAAVRSEVKKVVIGEQAFHLKPMSLNSFYAVIAKFPVDPVITSPEEDELLKGMNDFQQIAFVWEKMTPAQQLQRDKERAAILTLSLCDADGTYKYTLDDMADFENLSMPHAMLYMEAYLLNKAGNIPQKIDIAKKN